MFSQTGSKCKQFITFCGFHSSGTVAHDAYEKYTVDPFPVGAYECIVKFLYTTIIDSGAHYVKSFVQGFD